MAVNGYAAAQDVADLKTSTAALAVAMGTRVGANEDATAVVQATVAGIPAELEAIENAFDVGLNNRLEKGANLSDLVDDAIARDNLGLTIGTNVQAYSANLDEYAAVNPTAAGLALLDDADASAQRTTLAAVGTADLAASTGAALVGSIQTGAGAVARTAQAKMRDIVSVKDFGAKGDGVTNDRAAILAALSAADAIYIPAGTYFCGGTEIEITSPKQILGDGPANTALTWNGTSNGLHLNMADTSPAGCWDNRIDGIALINTSPLGTTSGGAGLKMRYCYYGQFNNIRIMNFYDGVDLVQSPISAFEGLNIETFGRNGFWCHGGYNFDVRINNFVISGQGPGPVVLGVNAILLEDMNDELVFQNGIINYCSVGLRTDATSFTVNQCPEYGRFFNVSFDSNSQGMDLAHCADIVFTSCFVSNRPNGGATIGQRGATRNVQYIGCTFQSNGGTGATLWPDAKFTNFKNCNFQSNSTVTPGTGHGVVVQGATTDFSFVGCDFSNGWGGGTQNFGLYITAASCNRFIVMGNYFTATGLGGEFVNASTGTDQNIIGNVGYELAAISNPTGGATVDAEARAAIDAILARLEATGTISV